jgi:hypothetical protein
MSAVDLLATLDVTLPFQVQDIKPRSWISRLTKTDPAAMPVTVLVIEILTNGGFSCGSPVKEANGFWFRCHGRIPDMGIRLTITRSTTTSVDVSLVFVRLSQTSTFHPLNTSEDDWSIVVDLIKRGLSERFHGSAGFTVTEEWHHENPHSP